MYVLKDMNMSTIRMIFSMSSSYFLVVVLVQFGN